MPRATAKIVTEDLNDTTPSVQITKAVTSTTVTDEFGRRIEVVKLTAWSRMKMFSVIGSENSANQAYLTYAMAAFSVTTIDGVPFLSPHDEKTLKAAIDRLDDAGINAVLQALVAFNESNNTVALAKN